MNVTLTTQQGAYGFGNDWSLHYESDNGTKKSFYLGQDVKFCSRVLGMSPAYIVQEIGDNDLRNEDTRKRLAEFIVDTLDLTDEQLSGLQPWELCCQ